jgi:hypothetical protein
MAPPLLIAHPQNATIEELKQVSRVGSNETVTRCSAIQMLLAGADRELVCHALLVTKRALRKWIMDNASWHKRKTTHWHNWQPMYLPPYSPDLNPIERIWLTMKARGFNNPVCKNEEKLLERLHQPILEVIDNPEKTQQTTAIGTLF